jgi:hypothetical protein
MWRRPVSDPLVIAVAEALHDANCAIGDPWNETGCERFRDGSPNKAMRHHIEMQMSHAEVAVATVREFNNTTERNIT